MNRLGYAFLIVFTAARAETDFPTSELAESVYYSRDLASPPPPPAIGMVYDLRTTPWSSDQTRAVKLISAETRPLAAVLLRSDSDQGWFDALAQRSHRVILLAPIGTTPAPDVAIPVTATEVATALAAITSGMDLYTLATPAITKRRFDEAELVRRHQGDHAAPPDATDEGSSAVPADTPPPDLMLQRAVQILQGLSALGRG